MSVASRIVTLSPDQLAHLVSCAKQWNAIGISRSEFRVWEKANRDCYPRAGPKRDLPIIRVSSPTVGAFAAQIAENAIASIKVSKTGLSSSESAVLSALDSAVRAALGPSIRSSVDLAVGSAVRSAACSEEDSVGDYEIDEPLDSEIESAVYAKIDTEVRFAYRLAACSAIDSAVHSGVISEAESGRIKDMLEQKTYDTFMHLQVVQQLIVLKQTYDASVGYYQQFEKLNSGKDYVQNVSAQIKTAVTADAQQLNSKITQAFMQPNTNTPVDQFVNNVNQGIYDHLKYATDEAANMVANHQIGANIATNANGLSPKDAANLSAQASGILVQMLTQIHGDDLRIIQLLSMQLASQIRTPAGQAQTMTDMSASMKSHIPNYQAPTDAGQGGGQ